MNAKTYLWNIFEVAREERTDGDNFEGDLGTAAACFVNGLGPGGKQYKCMEGLDKLHLDTVIFALVIFTGVALVLRSYATHPDAPASRTH